LSPDFADVAATPARPCHPWRVRRSELWLLGLALVLATAIAYGGVLGSGFVNYDDDLYVTERPEVRAGLTREGVVWALRSFQGANWFPLTRLSWMLDAELFGLAPAAFHATSLALHLAATAILFLALARLTGHPWPSAFAAGVFALHPLHVESVAWVSARKDVLAGLCFSLALLCHERVARSLRRARWSAARFACLALGLAAKPVLVTLPCVLLLLDAWPLRRLSRRSFLETLPLFALSAAASAVTLAAQRAGGALQALDRYPLAMRLEAAVDGIWVAVGKTLWPTGLAVFYPHPRGALPGWRVALGAAALVAVTAWTWRERRRRPWLAVGWLWFAGMLVPSSGIVQVGQAALADRYTYLPLTGLAIALAWSGRELAARGPRLARAVTASGAAALVALGAAAAGQVRHWRDSIALFEHALEATRGNHVAHINLAAALAGAGRLADAEPHLDVALALVPGSATAWGLRGEVRSARGRPAEAAADLRAALDLEPDSQRWRNGLARVHGRLASEAFAAGALAAALGHLDRVLALEPEQPGLQTRRGALLEQLGRSADAILAYRDALARGELSERVQNNLAWLLLTTGEPGPDTIAEALALAEAAARASGGDDAGILDTLATAQAAAGRRAEALATARRALERAEAHGQRGLARSLRERFPELGPPGG
jgi:tetratricopeptide (TPR) repeat protein